MTTLEAPGAPVLTLWDVHNAEAHVRAIAADSLIRRRARLDPKKRESLVAFLLGECWRISGLTADGRSARRDAIEYLAVIEISFASPRWSSLTGPAHAASETVGPFPVAAAAAAAGEQLVAEIEASGDRAAFSLLERRAPGMYDPNRGLAFSTFSWRILSLRVVDWFRDTFGDSRYGEHQLAVSLDALAEDENETVESFLDRHMPGATDHRIDQIHAHVYDHILVDEAVAGAIAR